MGKGGESVRDGQVGTDANDLSYLSGPVQLQWDFFAKAVPYLQAATDAELLSTVKQYSVFLQACQSSAQPGRPTFGIELVWRTHLLEPVAYAKDCAAICAGIIDHAILPVDKYSDTTMSWSGVDTPPLPLQLDGLVGAMRRQQNFMEKMLACRTAMDSAKFVRISVGKYMRFLGLMKRHRGKMLCPTLAIDLVWHTHQQMPARYAKEVSLLTGRFIDHDDHVEEEKLSDALAQTEALWEQAYGEPYLTHDDPTTRTPRRRKGGLAIAILTALALVASPSQQQVLTDMLLTSAQSTHRQMSEDNYTYPYALEEEGDSGLPGWATALIILGVLFGAFCCLPHMLSGGGGKGGGCGSRGGGCGGGAGCGGGGCGGGGGG